MDSSFFNSRMQEILYSLILRLLEKEGLGTQKASSTTATATSDSPGPTTAFEDLIQQASAKYSVDPKLIKAVITAESNFQSSVVSPAGAIGLMQLMPGTAASLGVANPYDPAQNIDGGAKLLRQLLSRYNGNVQYALAAYNAGPGAVDAYGGIPPYAETQRYVPRVLSIYQSLDRSV